MLSRLMAWMTVLLLAGSCSVLFGPEKASEVRDDAAGGACQDCSGCCDNGVCVTDLSTQACGANGGTCTSCNEISANRCVAGGCLCGDGPACQAGQQCTASGQCVCTSESCPSGCCGEGGLCSFRSFASCGNSGDSCQSCEASTADTCGGDSGDCECGEGPACAAGQRCENAACICDPTSCSGCCDGNDCVDDINQGTTKCGTAGGACTDCTEGSFEGTCESGACSGCTDTCATGCCLGSECVPASDSNSLACNGTSGLACEACGITADSCSIAGECVCGGNSACGDGQECVEGRCACTQGSCPDGCCDIPGEIGSQCFAQSAASCGFAGSTCESCQAGSRCNLDGACVCDSVSCPEGCCDDSGRCLPAGSSQNECGINGGECIVCNDGQECSEAAQMCVCNDVSCSGCCNSDTQECVKSFFGDGGVSLCTAADQP